MPTPSLITVRKCSLFYFVCVVKVRVSHLLLLVVVVRRFVRSSWEVVRSIALVVHHIQAAHSDERERRESPDERNARNTSESDAPFDFRRAVSSSPPLPPYMPKRIQRPCRPVCIETMRFQLCAPHSTTPGHRMDRSSVRHVRCIREKKSSQTSFQTASDWIKTVSLCF